jgi:hypothetical protein
MLWLWPAAELEVREAGEVVEARKVRQELEVPEELPPQPAAPNASIAITAAGQAQSVIRATSTKRANAQPTLTCTWRLWMMVD